MQAFSSSANWAAASTRGLTYPAVSGRRWLSSRTLMRTRPTLLILDEPTASLYLMAEQALFDRYLGEHETASGRITVLISHRFGTVLIRRSDRGPGSGRTSEVGSHAQLPHVAGHAQLWAMQTAGYR